MSSIIFNIVWGLCSVHAAASADVSSEYLTRAFDAAITELQGQPEWFHNLRTRHNYSSALQISTCTANATKWIYPEPKGRLKTILDTGVIKVAGVQWAKSYVDYVTNPDSPTGFWVDYLAQIIAQVAANYETSITIQRVYYANSNLVNEAVYNGTEVDMSEPYYYLGGFHGNRPRIEAFSFSCVTAGLASMFYVKAGSGITATDELLTAMATGNKKVGFIGAGNFHSVSTLLPADVEPVYETNGTRMREMVISGDLVAGYLSEGTPGQDSEVVRFETGIISPRVSLFPKDKPISCRDDGVLTDVEIAEQDLNSDHLKSAVDTAITELTGQTDWFINLRTKYNFTAALQVLTCTADPEKWRYPPADEVTGFLAKVLRTGVVRVGGVQWAQPGVADYKTNPENPVGFYVDYLAQIMAKISANYNKPIAIERVYFENSDLCTAAVDKGTVDMSEPWYYLGGFVDTRPRIEAFSFSCVVAATASLFTVKADSGITNTDQLLAAMATGNKKVGFIAAANFHTVSSKLPSNVEPQYILDGDEVIRAMIISGELVAGYNGEGVPGLDGEILRFETGIVSPRVALFRNDHAVLCPEAPKAFSAAPPMAPVGFFAIMSLVAAVVF